MDGIVEFLFGSLEGGGWIEGALNFLSGAGKVFEGGGAFEDVLGGAARRGMTSEGMLAWIMQIFDEGANAYFDYKCWQDMLGNRGSPGDFKNAWERMSQESREELEGLRDVVKGHSFFLNQLEAHKDKDGIAPLLEEYKALGTSLPSEPLLKKVRQKLARLVISGEFGADDRMAREFHLATDAVKDTEKRTLYENALHRNKAGVENLFEEFSKIDWKEFKQEESRRARLALPGAVESYHGARKWLDELSPKQKTGLAFAVIGGVALATYGVASALEHRRKKAPDTDKSQATQTISHQQRVQRQTGPLAQTANAIG